MLGSCKLLLNPLFKLKHEYLRQKHNPPAITVGCLGLVTVAVRLNASHLSAVSTYGSGVYRGSLLCRTYWVQLKTRYARPAKKSRGDRYPATGRTVKPERSVIETSAP